MFLKTKNTSQAMEEKPGASKLRRYDDKFLKLGFTVTSDGRPQCVICWETLAKESMKPSKLLRHLETKHSILKDKSLDFFKRKLSSLESQKSGIMETTNTNKKALLASYKVALHIAKAGKPHTIAEDLLSPCALELVSEMINLKAARKLTTVPLSNNSIARRIDDMANDVREQLWKDIKKSEMFTIQFDESTDVSGSAQFLCFIRFTTESAFREEILFCKALPGRATGEALFETFQLTIKDMHFNWDHCVRIGSDGAKAITGKNNGLVTRVKNMATKAVWTHCSIYRQ